MNDNGHAIPILDRANEGINYDAGEDEVEPMVEQTAVVPLGFQKRMLDDPIEVAAEVIIAKRKKTSDALSDSRENNELWDVMYERLSNYRQIHGDCHVPKKYAPDPKLGTWVETQRTQYKKLERGGEHGEAVHPSNRLTQERLGLLHALDFGWSARGRRSPSIPATPKRQPTLDERHLRLFDQQWDDFYQRLAKYKSKHGDTAVPRKYQADPELANWCEAQRVLWSREYPSELEAHEVPEALDTAEDIYMTEPFDSSVDGSADTRNENPLELVPVVTTEGPFRHESTGRPEENSLQSETSASSEPENYHLLESSTVSGVSPPPATEGLSMSDATPKGAVDLASPTAAGVLHLKGQANGALMDGSAAKAAEESMDADDSKPAPRYLTEERKAKLDELGFVWFARAKRVSILWDDMFKQLVEYRKRNGDCLVPSRYEENPKLGKWVETQRYEYTKLQRKAAASPSQVNQANEELAASKPTATNPRLTEERLCRLESIGFEWKVKNKMKRYYDKQWELMFERLLKFKEEHGHCMVPKGYPPDTKLATWVHTRRCQYRRMTGGSKGANDVAYMSDSGTEEEEGSRLTEERRKRLTELGFAWSVREVEKVPEPGRITRNSYDDQWDAMFQSLAAYKEKHGHCLVPKRYKEDPKLGTWVDTQRVQYKKMKKKLGAQDPQSLHAGDSDKPLLHRFTDERIRRLEDLGFVWSIRDDWQKHYEELQEFKNDHGHCNVPARYAKNRRLGIWVSAQRQQHKILKSGDEAIRKSTPLTQQRIDLLNELGFTWTVRSRDSLGESWNQRLQELQEYKKQRGDCLVPARYQPNPELGVWVGTQRTQHRLYMKAKEEGKQTSDFTSMTDERVQQLTELGFVFSLRGQDGKKDSDSLGTEAEAIEQEAIQVAGAMSSGSGQGTESGVSLSDAADSTVAEDLAAGTEAAAYSVVPGAADQMFLGAV